MPGTQDIGCVVDTCNYWSSGNRCKADRIMVEHNSAIASGVGAAAGAGRGAANMEVGTIGGGAHPRATTSDHTRCKTFSPK